MKKFISIIKVYVWSILVSTEDKHKKERLNKLNVDNKNFLRIISEKVEKQSKDNEFNTVTKNKKVILFK